MSDIIKKHAEDFSKRYINEAYALKFAISKLQEKVTLFGLDRNKLTFLNALKHVVEKDKQEHITKCKNPSCKKDDSYNNALFAIAQETEVVLDHYIPEPTDHNKFSYEEKVEISSKIDFIIEKIDELGIKHQIVFEELESLKDRMDLSKKDWIQLLKGKLVDLSTERVLEATVIQTIYQTITESLKAGYLILPH